MTSYFNLLKYAQTGIASPDMTYYDKMRASTLMGGAVQSLTGQPPLSFKADGKPLISWSMKGNGSQTGTPSPDNPIQPEFVGTGTNTNVIGNFSTLLTSTITSDTGASIGEWISYGGSGVTHYMACGGNEKYYVHLPADYTGFVRIYTANTTRIPTSENSVFINRIARDDESQVDYVFTTPPNAKQIIIQFSSASADYVMTNATFDRGYKIPITCAGRTTPVYLGQTQTVRKILKLVLTGNESWDNSTTYPSHFKRSLTGTVKVAPICTHYRGSNSSAYSSIANGYCSTSASSNSQIVIHDDRYTTIKDWKSYLAAQYASGTPVTVWYVLATPETGIVSEPLAKIGDYADELHSEDAGVSIPTVKGQNTLTVETELQPSEMSITYRG